MANKTPIPNFLPVPRTISKEVAIMTGTESIKFFKESFVKQGFTDTSFKKWQKLKYQKGKGHGKRILRSTGHLMQNIKKEVGNGRVTVYNDCKYADIHNSGGTITKKDGTRIEMPQRQFMGNSKALMDILEKKGIEIKRTEMLKAFKNIKL